MDKTMDKKELQSKIVEFKSTKENLEQLQEYMKNTSSQLDVVQQTMHNLQELSTLPEGNEILVPVAGGVFMKAATCHSGTFVVNIGAQTVVEKDLTSLLVLLEEQKKDLEEVRLSIKHDFDTAEQKAANLHREIKGMME